MVVVFIHGEQKVISKSNVFCLFHMDTRQIDVTVESLASAGYQERSEDREQINNDLELWLSYPSSCKTAGFFGIMFVHSVKN